MDCDQVFAALTRGPFPSGASDDVLVDEHIDTCASCQLFVEALRPAHDLFHESLPPVESRHLPSYWGETLRPEPVFKEPVGEVHRSSVLERSDGTATSLEALATRRAATRAQPVGVRYPATDSTGPHWFSVLCLAGLTLAAFTLATGYVWPVG